MKRTSEEIEALVYNALGIGKEKALSRSDLVMITQSSDRQVRAAIESLRHNKAILTLPGGNGYYLPPDTEEGRTEAVRWIVQQNKRIRSIRESQRGAREFAAEEIGRKAKKPIKQIPGQISIFGGVQ